MASPEYEAVIVWLPVARVAMVKDAEPALSAEELICVPPSRKATEPVGVLVPDCGFTVAVNVTLWPLVNCVAEAESAVVVAVFGGADTVTETAAEVDAAKFVSPP